MLKLLMHSFVLTALACDNAWHVWHYVNVIITTWRRHIWRSRGWRRHSHSVFTLVLFIVYIYIYLRSWCKMFLFQWCSLLLGTTTFHIHLLACRGRGRCNVNDVRSWRVVWRTLVLATIKIIQRRIKLLMILSICTSVVACAEKFLKCKLCTIIKFNFEQHPLRDYPDRPVLFPASEIAYNLLNFLFEFRLYLFPCSWEVASLYRLTNFKKYRNVGLLGNCMMYEPSLKFYAGFAYICSDASINYGTGIKSASSLELELKIFNELCLQEELVILVSVCLIGKSVVIRRQNNSSEILKKGNCDGNFSNSIQFTAIY